MAIEDVEVAIATAITEDAAVKAIGLTLATGRQVENTNYPYAEMLAPIDTRTGRTSDSLYYWKQVQFKTYAESRAAAAQAADAICNVLNDDVDLNQFSPGVTVLEIQRGNVSYLQEEDAVWCYLLLFNVKYYDARHKPPL